MNDIGHDLSEQWPYVNDDDNTESRIARLVDMMSYQERAVFVSYYYNQLSIEDIASETGIPIRTVYSCLADASRKAADIAGHTGKYYVALMIFFALGNEASVCHPP
ncbi:MAG: sigma-70 region 4 domain-containing protein [Lachnospiraceae bacterium]|nr:sigma-70 region 4 domain-containing protein [Lachnospiraceae bacterium]